MSDDLHAFRSRCVDSQQEVNRKLIAFADAKTRFIALHTGVNVTTTPQMQLLKAANDAVTTEMHKHNQIIHALDMHLQACITAAQRERVQLFGDIPVFSSHAVKVV